MTKQIVAFCNFANTPKIVSRFGNRMSDLIEEVGFFVLTMTLLVRVIGLEVFICR